MFILEVIGAMSDPATTEPVLVDKVKVTVLDTDNLHFSKEFLEFPARADTDICTDALRFSARYRAEESKQEFHTDLCGKW